MVKKISITEELTVDEEDRLKIASLAVKDVVSKFLKENFDNETSKSILAVVCINLIKDWSKGSRINVVTEFVRFINLLNILVDHEIKRLNL